MNKTDLIKKVAAENELTQKSAAAVVDSVLNWIPSLPVSRFLSSALEPFPADTVMRARAATPQPVRP